MLQTYKNKILFSFFFNPKKSPIRKKTFCDLGPLVYKKITKSETRLSDSCRKYNFSYLKNETRGYIRMFLSNSIWSVQNSF